MLFSRRHVLAAALAAPISARAENGGDDFTLLEAKPGSLRLRPEPAAPTPVQCFNGAVPGPLLRVRKGEELRLRLANGLAQPTALHFQGVRLPNGMDGAAGLTQAAVAPGQSFDYRFAPPDSGLFWYRPSAMPFAAEQLARGLYGLLIVDEPEPPLADLDLPLVIGDWRLDERGAIPPGATEARDGELVTVNSRPIPLVVEQAPGARIRLRLVNACGTRLMAALFENIRPIVMAIDGQPCDPFEPARLTLPAGPGARFDLMFDLPAQAGMEARVKLRGGGLRADPGGEPDRDIVVFKTTGEPRERLAPIAGLGLNPLLPPEIKLQNARRLDINIEGPGRDPAPVWTLNGPPTGKPLFTAARGQPVSLGFINKTDVAHCAHVHGHVMRVLHLLDDGWEPYWRDTVIVPPGKTVRVAFLADNPGKWLIDSTILAHAAAGLSAWFEVS